jgi:hypothetical protein
MDKTRVVGHDQEHVAGTLEVPYDGLAGAFEDANDAGGGSAVVTAGTVDEAGDDFVAVEGDIGVFGGDEERRAFGAVGFGERDDQGAPVLPEGNAARDEIGLGGLAKLVPFDANEAAGREEKADFKGEGAAFLFI